MAAISSNSTATGTTLQQQMQQEEQHFQHHQPPPPPSHQQQGVYPLPHHLFLGNSYIIRRQQHALEEEEELKKEEEEQQQHRQKNNLLLPNCNNNKCRGGSCAFEATGDTQMLPPPPPLSQRLLLMTPPSTTPPPPPLPPPHTPPLSATLSPTPPSSQPPPLQLPSSQQHIPVSSLIPSSLAALSSLHPSTALSPSRYPQNRSSPGVHSSPSASPGSGDEHQNTNGLQISHNTRRVAPSSSPLKHMPMAVASPGLPRLLSSTSPPYPPPEVSPIHAGIKEQFRNILLDKDSNTALAENKTKALCTYYHRLIPADKDVFLKILSADYGLNHNNVVQLAKSVQHFHDRGETVMMRFEQRLRQALTPRYQYLFTQISHLEGGVKFLVDLRSELLSMLTMAGVDQDDPKLHAMNTCLKELLSLWFSVGFLELKRITWESPCDMLQKISDYEAVHPIRNWADVKRRVGPYRRCFVYTHASMPREPVVVLHTALTKDISASIQTIVERTRISLENNSESDHVDMTEDPKNINTAIFYSITSTQKGLQGVELGNYIIKNAVREILSEFPHIYQFSSLSPIPGFRDWLLTEINKHLHKQDIGETVENDHIILTREERSELNSLLGCPPKKSTLLMLRKTLQSNAWVHDDQLKRALQVPLTRLCARYLYLEKRRGFALNPVANFHLRNGAVMWRINWLADTTARGITASCSLMVNYRYFLDQTESNTQQYMEHKDIPASEQVLQLISSPTVSYSSYSSPASSNHSLSSP